MVAIVGTCMGGTYTCGGVLASTNYAVIFEFSPGSELHCKGSPPGLYSNDSYTIFGAMVVHLGIHSTLIHAHASLLMLISFLSQLCWSVFCKTGYPHILELKKHARQKLAGKFKSLFQVICTNFLIS
jgi:hypothetical protein